MKLNWERRAKAKVTPKTDQVAALFKTEAGQEANEAWLLHGCKPEVVWKILQKGLNEKLCQLTGAFGAGIYLAEDVEKIDQYTTPDPSYGFSGLEELHRRLYRPGGNVHPGEDIFYCFVVQTLCGWPIRTRDGMSDLDDPSCNWVYANQLAEASTPNHKSRRVCPSFPQPCDVCRWDKLNRRDLKEVNGVEQVRHHSLVVETGEALQRFREFVCFDNKYTLCKYLLAYKRV
jgi:hypothetical protein